MDIITYALSKKIAAHALSGVQSMSVSGQTLTINTKDSGVLTMTFPTPKDGVSITDIDVNANNQIVFTMSDGSEFISGKIPTVKGDKGDPHRPDERKADESSGAGRCRLRKDYGSSPFCLDCVWQRISVMSDGSYGSSCKTALYKYLQISFGARGERFRTHRYD